MSMTRTLPNGSVIECRVGDIAAQADLDAVVNAATAELRTGGGVAGSTSGRSSAGRSPSCPDS